MYSILGYYYQGFLDNSTLFWGGGEFGGLGVGWGGQSSNAPAANKAKVKHYKNKARKLFSGVTDFPPFLGGGG